MMTDGFFNNISGIIQVVIMPAVMISACGLLFLGLQNRYGRIIDRLREFLEEKRAIKKSGEHDGSLITIIENEIQDLLKRGLLIKNSVRLLMTAIFIFVLTSLCIASHVVFQREVLSIIIFILFIFGYLSVLLSISFAIRELNLSYTALSKECSVE